MNCAIPVKATCTTFEWLRIMAHKKMLGSQNPEAVEGQGVSEV